MSENTSVGDGKGVKDIVTKTKDTIKIDEKNLNDYLGVKKFKYGEIENKDGTGIVTGLAWTEVGGELLTIESVVMPGKGKMEITGKLGEVMQESVKAAKSFVRSRCIEYGIIPPVFENWHGFELLEFSILHVRERLILQNHSNSRLRN